MRKVVLNKIINSYIEESKKALDILSKKKLGVLIVHNKQKKTKGIITDGQLRRFNQKNLNLHSNHYNSNLYNFDQ